MRKEFEAISIVIVNIKNDDIIKTSMHVNFNEWNEESGN